MKLGIELKGKIVYNGEANVSKVSGLFLLPRILTSVIIVNQAAVQGPTLFALAPDIVGNDCGHFYFRSQTQKNKADVGSTGFTMSNALSRHPESTERTPYVIMQILKHSLRYVNFIFSDSASSGALSAGVGGLPSDLLRATEVGSNGRRLALVKRLVRLVCHTSEQPRFNPRSNPRFLPGGQSGCWPPHSHSVGGGG